MHLSNKEMGNTNDDDDLAAVSQTNTHFFLNIFSCLSVVDGLQ